MKRETMGRSRRTHERLVRSTCLALGLVGLAIAGCSGPALRDAVDEAYTTDHPRELQKASIPPYRVEPPDILSIELVENIRPSDDPLRVGDELVIRGAKLLPQDDPNDPDLEPLLKESRVLDDFYSNPNDKKTHIIHSDGTVDLGLVYGKVLIEGLTVDEAKDAILKHLRDEIGLAGPIITIVLPDVSGKQIVQGEHLVRPDGTVSLGIYGSVYVAGMSLDEVKAAVEHHLSGRVYDPEVTVDVLAYNSKKIYVITDGGGSGETVASLPYVGNETVLDAIAQIQGLSEVSSKRMWIARPAPNDPSGVCVAQTMQIDWRGLTQDAITTTNYQLMPGDRIYIQADGLVAMDNVVAKVITPWQRIFGFTLLGQTTIQRLRTGGNNNQGGGGFGGGAF